VRFRATLEARGRGHVIALPFDAKEKLGAARAPVQVTINGHAFRTTTMRYGGVDYVGLNREVRAAAGVSVGDSVDVELERDRARREVDVPAELERVLARDRAAKQAFARLSYTHRKEYARWIAEAKREETRDRRLVKAVEMLQAGVKTLG
jgi:Bacteriocin-protection, YdeI or OmpD-Associated/Domain of unknown function (DUF1905)